MKKKSHNLQTDTSSEKMTTLTSATNNAAKKGYSLNFQIHDNGMLWDGDKLFYHPDEVNISNFYRFEGESDPADSSILYLLTANDGNKGMLVDAYGVYNDALLSDFVKQVSNIEKKKHHHKRRKRSVREIAGFVSAAVLVGIGTYFAVKKYRSRKCV